MEKPRHQTDTKCPLFLCKFGSLDIEKKKVYILYQTESLAKDYVLHYLGKYHSLERRRKKKAFEKVGCGDAIGKVKDLNTHTHMNFEAELLVVS